MVTVVVVAYDGDKWLRPCVRSLQEASSRRLHLVLVDNSQNTIIDDLDLSAFQAEIIETPRPMGFAEANNYALVEASHLESYVLFLNQDTISYPNWIDRCVDLLQDNHSYAAVSPLIRTYDGSGWDPNCLRCLNGTYEEVTRGSGPDIIEVEHLPAPSFLVRTAVLKQTGPFDPIFGSYFEDYDLCLRIRNCGYRIGFCGGTRIRHFSGSATTTRARERNRMRQLIRNRVIYEMRAGRAPRWKQALGFLAGDFPHRLARGLLGTPSSQPPGVTLLAYGDLLRVGARIVSKQRDQSAWEAYLKELGWPVLQMIPD